MLEELPLVCYKQAVPIVMGWTLALFITFSIVAFGIGFQYQLGKRLGLKLGNLINFKRKAKKK